MAAKDVVAGFNLLMELSALLRRRAYAQRTLAHTYSEEQRLRHELALMGITDVDAALLEHNQGQASRHPDDLLKDPLTFGGQPNKKD